MKITAKTPNLTKYANMRPCINMYWMYMFRRDSLEFVTLDTEYPVSSFRWERGKDTVSQVGLDMTKEANDLYIKFSSVLQLTCIFKKLKKKKQTPKNIHHFKQSLYFT